MFLPEFAFSEINLNSPEISQTCFFYSECKDRKKIGSRETEGGRQESGDRKREKGEGRKAKRIFQ